MNPSDKQVTGFRPSVGANDTPHTGKTRIVPGRGMPIYGPPYGTPTCFVVLLLYARPPPSALPALTTLVHLASDLTHDHLRSAHMPVYASCADPTKGLPLWEASGRGDTKEVERLLEGGADPGWTNPNHVIPYPLWRVWLRMVGLLHDLSLVCASPACAGLPHACVCVCVDVCLRVTYSFVSVPLRIYLSVYVCVCM
jgi:hypothetical protein